MNKIYRFIVLWIILVFVVTIGAPLFADTPATNLPYRVTSANGEYFVEMLPQLDSWGGYGAGRGTAYRVSNQGNPEVLWTVDFYSSQAILTNDGRHLIAFGPWASEMTDLAIAFYADGKETKRYLIRDLIRDESKLERSVSHFFWRGRSHSDTQGLSEDEKSFSLTLIDGSVCVFDVSSGEILKREQPAVA